VSEQADGDVWALKYADELDLQPDAKEALKRAVTFMEANPKHAINKPHHRLVLLRHMAKLPTGSPEPIPAFAQKALAKFLEAQEKGGLKALADSQENQSTPGTSTIPSIRAARPKVSAGTDRNRLRRLLENNSRRTP
jgi:hypothetical protein